MNGTEKIQHLPDTDEHWIYLVWGIGKFADGSTAEILYAIDTTKEKAEQHKELASKRGSFGWPKMEHFYIEERWTNHFFGLTLPPRFMG